MPDDDQLDPDPAGTRDERESVGRAIVEGYERISEDGDLPWPDANTAAMIAEEPW